MIVFSENIRQASASRRDIEAGTNAARLQGARIYHIPEDFRQCENAEGALDQVPIQDKPVSAVWLGYIPTPERYRTIYQAALRRNIHLVNRPEEHLRAQEFDLMYPWIKELTPASAVIRDLSDCEAVGKELGFPIFVKGVVQSRKAKGLRACLAENQQDLRQLAGFLFELESRTRGRVIARRYIPLKHHRSNHGFPMGREYRIFLYKDEIVGMGYYWEGEDELMDLSAAERREVVALAVQTSKQLKVPFISVDIGQAESGKWWVIETGDGQFSGLCQIPFLTLWANLHRLCEA